MATTTLLSLRQLLSEAIGDWLEFDTSTSIDTTTGTSIDLFATTLKNWDGGEADYFNDWWINLVDGSTLSSNVGLTRRVRDYFSSDNRVCVYGSDLKKETSAVTCRLHRFDPRNKTRAINRAIEQLYPSLHRRLDILNLVTGNILPDFQWWTSTSAHKFWTKSANATLTKTAWSTTNAEYIRGQRDSIAMKVEAGAASQYAYITSKTYPRLLDLTGKTVSLYCWAYPSAGTTAAPDVALVIHTISNDGSTTQTLASTTGAVANYLTKLELESQTLNDDLDEIRIWLRVTTSGEDCYFSDPVLCGMHLYEYMLPEDLQAGHLSKVGIQTTGWSELPAYDLQPRYWDFTPQFRIVDDGTYKFLRLKDMHTNLRRIRLQGYAPLETLTADTDTISLDGEKLNLLVAQAAYNLYQMERGVVASEDRGRYEQELAYWAGQVRRLKPTLMMMRPSDVLWTGG